MDFGSVNFLPTRVGIAPVVLTETMAYACLGGTEPGLWDSQVLRQERSKYYPREWRSKAWCSNLGICTRAYFAMLGIDVAYAASSCAETGCWVIDVVYTTGSILQVA